MFSDKEKEWMKAICKGEIRHYAEFALHESSSKLLDQHMKKTSHPFAVTSIRIDGDEDHYAIMLDCTTFFDRLHAFQALVYQLVKQDLIVIVSDGRTHAINIHQGCSSGGNVDKVSQSLHTAISTKLEARSIHLESDQLNEMARESFLRLPKLESYINNGFRTQDQLEHDDLKLQAQSARADAKRANTISIGLAFLSLTLGLVTILVQWYSVSNPTKVDINSLPSTTRTFPSFQQWQQR